jgi:hypothetical protein
MTGLRRRFASLTSALSRFCFGENQIAVAFDGREAIWQEDWARLPEEERGKWEPASVDPLFYVPRTSR